MVLALVGLLLLIFGLFAGALLLAAPLGLVSTPPGMTLWLLFPGFSLSGYLLFLTAARTARINAPAFAASVLLLLLALTAAGGLLLDAANIRPTIGSSLALWYVLVIAGSAGITGVAAHGRQTADS